MAREHEEKMQGKGRNEESAQSTKSRGRMDEQHHERTRERSSDMRDERSKSK